MMRHVKISMIMLFILLAFSTCVHHRHAKINSQEQVARVTKQPLSTTLFYSGIIAPLKATVITTPTDGVVRAMSFHYGDEVKSGELLFLLSSEKFQTDYKTALMQYIKTKTDFMNGQSQLKEGEFLHKNQLISDDDYKAKETNFYNSRLAMLQAKDALSNLLKQVDLQDLDLYNLKIEDIDKINQVLHSQNGLQELHIVAPKSGIVLLPVKESSADSSVKKISQGDQVKQGDVLAVIGDVSGFTVHIDVSEFNINQLKVGQKVVVTGDAFPAFSLAGEISGLDHQAQANQSGLPTFSVEVTVTKLTPEQQAVIHIGMSAKVAIDVGGAVEVTVPIRAVVLKNDKAYINVQDQKSGKIREMLVKTGQTTQDSVVLIESNLQPGDKVVFPH